MIIRKYWLVLTACMVTSLFSACRLQASPAPADVVVDDNAPGWMWSGAPEFSDPSLYGGSAHVCGPGGSGAYTFNGVGISVYVYQARSVEVDSHEHKIGRLKVSIDGAVDSVVSESALAEQYNVETVKIRGLKAGIHVLQVETEGGWVVVDYVKIAQPPVIPPSSTDGDVAPDGHAAGALSAAPVVLANLPQGTYEILAAGNPSESLDVWSNTTDDGIPVRIYTLNTDQRQLNQRFQIVVAGGNIYRISPMNVPSKALTYSPASEGDLSSPAMIWAYQSVPAEHWMIFEVGHGTYRFSPSNAPNLALGVSSGAMVDAVRVNVTLWSASPSQLWVLKKD